MVFGRIRIRWGRSVLTVLAIAISFSMLLSLTSVSLGLYRTSEERFNESPRDIVISSTGLTPSIEGSHMRAEELNNDSNISASMPLLTILGTLSFDPNIGSEVPRQDLGIGAVDPVDPQTFGIVGLVPELAENFMSDDNELFIRSDILKFEGWFQEEGDPFYENNYTGQWTGEILLDSTIMDENSLERGDIVYFLGGEGNAVSSFIIKGSVDTSLAGEGLTGDIIGGIAVVHLSELQYVTGNHYKQTPQGPIKDLSTAIYVDLQKDILSSDEQKDVALSISKEFPGLDVTSKESRLYRIEEEVLVLEVFSVSVAISSLSIGVLFLSSIMMIEVDERRSDISIMRSIGISRRTIFLQIMKDSLLLAVLGSLIGILPGYFGSLAIDSYLRDLYGLRVGFTEFEPLLVLGGLFYVILLVLIFSLVPAFRATTVVPKVGMASHYNR